jgi:zinc protease
VTHVKPYQYQPPRTAIPEPKAPPEKAVTRVAHGKSAVTSLRYANDLQVHLRPMKYDREEVQIALLARGGTSRENPQSRGLTSAGAVALNAPATSALSSHDAQKIGRDAALMIYGGNDRSGISIAAMTNRSRLEEAFRLLHHLITDAHVEEAALARWKQRVHSNLDAQRFSLDAQISKRIDRFIFGKDIRFVDLTAQRATGIGHVDAQRWLREQLHTSPVDVAVVGDFDLEQVVALSGRYLGTLPSRPVSDESLARAYRADGESGPVSERLHVRSQAQRAHVYLGWRIPGHPDDSTLVGFDFLTDILEDRLREALRQVHGLVYSVSCHYAFSQYENASRIEIAFDTDPGRHKEAVEVASEVVRRFREEGPTAAEVQVTRKQQLSALAVSVQEPGYWSGLLPELRGTGRTLDVIASADALIAGLGTKDIHELAGRYLVDAHHIRILGRSSPDAASD